MAGQPIRFQLFPNLPQFAKATKTDYHPAPQSGGPAIQSTATTNSNEMESNENTKTEETKTASSAAPPPTNEQKPTAAEQVKASNEQPSTGSGEKVDDEDSKNESTNKEQTKSEEKRKPNAPINKPAAPTNTNAVPSHLQPIAAKEVDGTKLPGIAIIHLDPFINQLPEYYNNIPGVTQIDYCGGNVDKCLKLIQEDYKEGRIFLLSSGGLAREVVPKIHKLPQLHAVYILCENVTGHREWSSKYSKVRVVGFDEEADRWPFLAVDLARTQEDFGDARAKAGNKDPAKTRYEKALEILKKVDGHDPKWTEVISKKISAMN